MPRIPSILMVDDEADIITIFTRILRTQGFDVRGFTDPIFALKEFQGNHQSYDLVISDIRMQSMDGIEFSRRVRSIKPSVKLLLMTAAFEMSRLSQEAIDPVKIGDIMVKPIPPKIFVDTVKKHLGIGDGESNGRQGSEMA